MHMLFRVTTAAPPVDQAARHTATLSSVLRTPVGLRLASNGREPDLRTEADTVIVIRCRQGSDSNVESRGCRSRRGRPRAERRARPREVAIARRLEPGHVGFFLVIPAVEPLNKAERRRSDELILLALSLTVALLWVCAELRGRRRASEGRPSCDATAGRATHKAPELGLVGFAPGLGRGFELLELGENLALDFGRTKREGVLTLLDPNLADRRKLL